MTTPQRKRLLAPLLPFAALAPLLMPAAVRAQAFPSRSVRMLVPTPPGSSVDLSARIVAERLRERLGQPVIVENRPGAGGTIAAAEVARSAPDGHVLLVGFNGPLATAGLLYPKLAYKPLELTPVIATVTQPHVMVVSGTHPANGLKEFVARAKASPGRYNYASVGNASGSHLAMELFKSVAGLYVVHIPYNGGPAATQAVMNGDVDSLFTALVNVQGQVSAKRLKVLGLAEKNRSPAAPDVPTFAEQGYPQVEAPLFNGIAGPPGMPQQVVRHLNAEIEAVLADPTVRQRLSAGGMEVIGGPPERLAALTRAEAARWSPVIRRLDIQLD